MQSGNEGEVQLANRLLAPLETLTNIQHLLRGRLTEDAEVNSLLSISDQALTEMIGAIQISLNA